MNNQKKRSFSSLRIWRNSLLILLLAFAVATAGVFFYGGSLIQRAVRAGLTESAASMGLSVRSVEVEGGIGRVVVMRDLWLTPVAGTPRESKTFVHIEHIEIAACSLWELLFNRDRLISRASVSGVEAVLDYRKESRMASSEPPNIPTEDTIQEAKHLLRFLPMRVDLQGKALTLLTDRSTLKLHGIELTLLEGRNGIFKLAGGKFLFDEQEQLIAPCEAPTAWKNGIAYLAGISLGEGVEVQTLQVDTMRGGGPSIALSSEVLGGWLRADIGVFPKKGDLAFNATVWAGKLPVGKLQQMLHLGAEETGEIVNARLSFRGLLKDVLEAEISVRLQAKDITWQKRRWEDLVIGAQLRNRSIELSEFHLEQKENFISASGKVGWPTDGNWKLADGKLTVQAEIKNLSALSDLVGDSVLEASGRLNINASLVSGNGICDGTISADGANLTWRGTPLGAFSGAAVFRGQDVEITSFQWKNRKDSLSAQGKVHVADRLIYEGEIRGNIESVSDYLALVWPGEKSTIPSGKVWGRWQGDGTRGAHSGGIELHFHEFYAETFPKGITGQFSGTYSPDNIYLGSCELVQNAMKLTWTLFAGKEGVFMDQIALRAGGKTALQGKVYLPWNPLCLQLSNEWQNGILPEHSFYAEVRSSGLLNGGDLADLLGQQTPFSGQIGIQVLASGDLTAPQVDAEVQLANVRTMEKSPQNVTTLSFLQMGAANGAAWLTGKMERSKNEPATLSLQFPFGFQKNGEQWAWRHPEAPLNGKIIVPHLDLSLFRSFYPKNNQAKGILGIDVVLGGTLFAPTLNGRIAVQGGEFLSNLFILKNLNGTSRWSGDSFALESMTGEVNTGAVTVSGNGSIAHFADPTLDLQFKGEHLLIKKDANIHLWCDTDLRLQGTLGAGEITGAIHLVDGKLFHKFEMAPLLEKTTAEPTLLPDYSGKVPASMEGCKLQITVDNGTPFWQAGNQPGGDIQTALRITGTLGDPRLSGNLTFRNIVAFFPAAEVTISEGKITFLEEAPRSPSFDIQGVSKVLDYEINISAKGTLDQKNIFLQSEPPLSEEAILSLLHTGIEPSASVELTPSSAKLADAKKTSPSPAK